MPQIRLDPFENLPHVSHVSDNDSFVIYRRSTGKPVLLDSERFEIIFGTGDSVDGDIVDRVETLEASFLVQADLIEAKVSQTEFDDLDNQVSSMQTSLSLLSDEIELKASQQDFDDLGNQVSSNESSITINANEILNRVTSTTFNELEGRVDSAETTISQQADEIALRATQSEVDDIDGRVTTAEANITINADEIAQRVTQATFDTLDGRVTTAESEIVQNADAILLRVTQTEFDDLGDRVTTAETDITQNANEITLRATKTELNSSIEEVLESLTPAVRFQFLNSVEGWTGSDATLTAGASTLDYDATAAGAYMERTGLAIAADDNPIFYIRFRRTAGTGFGGRVDFTTDGSTWHDVALTEPTDPDAWNTFRVDVGDDPDYTGTVTGLRLYMGEGSADEFEVDLIEVGRRGADALVIEDLDGRLTLAESEISINADEIAQRVTQATFDTLDGRVTTAESEIVQNADAILLRVTQTEFDDLGSQVSTNESNISQNATEIQARVTTTTFDQLEDRVSSAETTITQHADEIDLRATTSQLNTLGNQVDSNEASITVNANEILNRVTTTTFNNLEQRVSSAESDITQNADQILLRVTQTEFNDLDTRVTTAESNITQNADEIALRVTQTVFNDLDTRVGTAESNITQNADEIALRVTTSTFNDLDQQVSTNSTQISQTNNTIENEVLASGKTRSRMTQDMEGFQFEANRFQSSNWNGDINGAGEMVTPGTVGWAFDKNGVMSVKQAFIAGLEVNSTSMYKDVTADRRVAIGDAPWTSIFGFHVGADNDNTIRLGIGGGGNYRFQVRRGGETHVELGDLDNYIRNLSVKGSLKLIKDEDGDGVLTNENEDYKLLPSGIVIEGSTGAGGLTDPGKSLRFGSGDNHARIWLDNFLLGQPQLVIDQASTVKVVSAAIFDGGVRMNNLPSSPPSGGSRLYTQLTSEIDGSTKLLCIT